LNVVMFTVKLSEKKKAKAAPEGAAQS